MSLSQLLGADHDLLGCNRSGANVGEQVGDGDDVIAMRAGSSGAKPTAEYAALVTALLTEEAGFAFGGIGRRLPRWAVG
jgi:hypothetical protein